jgi:hypothetical protein
MPSENDSNTPPVDPQGQQLPQRPETPLTPEQDKMGEKALCSSQNEETPATKLERDIKTGEICLIVINGLLLITSIVIAFIYNGQLKEMRKATRASEKSANAAATASDTAARTLISQQKSFEIDQRPYLVGEVPVFSGLPFAANTSIHVNFTYKNIGRTPAIRDFTYIRLSPYHAPKAAESIQRVTLRKFFADEMRQIRERERRYRSEASHLPEGEIDIAPGAGTFTSNQGDSVLLSTEEFAEIQKPDTHVILVVMGLSTYTDGFGNPYETEYCWFYVGPDPHTWHRCQAYNTIK